ncbi:CoA transferase [Arthrobacter sp. NPDC057013]|uniref:CoA transferase n=1 Tax=Arthrobacter sp. NPDC057013 TaxID=3345999 RepID=UPI00362B6D5A
MKGAAMNGNGKGQAVSGLTDRLRHSINNPLTSTDFDFAAVLDDVLATVGLSVKDAGGNVRFYGGADPLIASPFQFGAAAAVALGAKGVAASAVWRDRGGGDQDIAIDVRKAFQRFSGFADGRWEKINGRPPSVKGNKYNPFGELPFFRATRDGRHVVALNVYPGLHQKALTLLDCADNGKAVNEAIANRDADELEEAAAAAGIIIAKVRSTEEFLQELQYQQVLQHMPLISVEKIANGDPQPLAPGASTPLEGIRALGMGHVIAGSGMGRDLASFGADVLNVWRPDDSEVEMFYWDTQVGMRSTYLSDSGDDRAKMDELLREADVFFSNRHPGHLEQVNLTAEKVAAGHRGLIHAQVLLHGAEGPWATRPGFDEIGACVSGIFALGGTLEDPKMPPMLPIVDNIVGWFGTVGILEALRRRAVEGGSYRVRVSLTRICLWLISLGIFDKEFAAATAGSSAEHAAIPPELFTAQTPLGTYQGMTDQIEFTSLPQGFTTTVLQPMGADRPEWLPLAVAQPA